MKPEPGLAFAMPIAGGYLAAIYTHEHPIDGSLVWIAQPTFDQLPTEEDVTAIRHWRWPVFYSVAAAIRRKVVVVIGQVAVPPDLRAFPIMRSGDRHIGWVAFKFVDGKDVNLGPTSDWKLPISKSVGDVSLREKVESNWRPEDQT
jgi:hypothetical protein